MKVIIETMKLQALVAKAVKGAGFNKLLPITGMIGITIEDGMHLYTTDGSNYLCVYDNSIEGDSFDVTVDAEMFYNLVAKLTSNEVTLEVVDDVLIISGNGKYKLALQLNDSGEKLVFPKNLVDESDDVIEILGALSLNTINVMLSSIKPSLSTTAGTIYNNYYVGDCIIGTDRDMLCKYDGEKFDPMVFTRSFVDLLGIATSDVTLSKSGNCLTAVSDNLIIKSKITNDASYFNIEGINKMLDLKLDSYCRVNKKELLSLLDRLSIFVSAYDDGAVFIHFTKDSLEVSSLSSSGVESIDYTEFKNFKDTTIKIDINRLITQLKAYQSDFVDLYYGNDLCVKLVDGDLLAIIALMR